MNKAQEITGAVLPIADRHRFASPMLGCILIGEYTAPAIEQLNRQNFKILYLKYTTVIEAFKTVGIDAWFDEKTPEEVDVERMKQWNSLSEDEKSKVWGKVAELNERNIKGFMLHLERAVKRQITAVRVIPLHGTGKDCVTVQDAVTFVETYDETTAAGPLVKYEVIIRYDNGDKIEAFFDDRANTIEFLQAYETGNWTPAIEDQIEEVV